MPGDIVRGIREWLLNGYDENVLEFDSGDGCTTLPILKTTEVYTLKGWTLWDMNYIPIKLLKEKSHATPPGILLVSIDDRCKDRLN